MYYVVVKIKSLLNGSISLKLKYAVKIQVLFRDKIYSLSFKN